MKKSNGIIDKLSSSFPAFFAIVILISIVIPLPILIVDILIGLNLLFALIILLNVLYTSKTTKITLLPTFLLISSVFTLSINISINRHILTKGADFDGWFILTISNIFAGTGETAQLYIGFILFIVILAICIIILTKGCTRVAEAAARFTLDIMQVKLMAIETEYSSGIITEEEVKKQKAEVSLEVDFYGSLDGASKFIFGNAKLLFFMIFIIIIPAGILIDIFTRSAEIVDAIKTYIYLAIGSGIVFILPVFLISVAVGIAVTRLVYVD